MTIEKKPTFYEGLTTILRYIAKDKKSAARKFERNLNRNIKSLIDNPLKCRASYYFDDAAYRDMIYCGYTIIYKVEKEKIIILEIFKWQDR